MSRGSLGDSGGRYSSVEKYEDQDEECANQAGGVCKKNPSLAGIKVASDRNIFLATIPSNATCEIRELVIGVCETMHL